MRQLGVQSVEKYLHPKGRAWGSRGACKGRGGGMRRAPGLGFYSNLPQGGSALHVCGIYGSMRGRGHVP